MVQNFQLIGPTQVIIDSKLVKLEHNQYLFYLQDNLFLEE